MPALARRGSPLPTTQSSTSPYTGEEFGWYSGEEFGGCSGEEGVRHKKILVKCLTRIFGV